MQVGLNFYGLCSFVPFLPRDGQSLADIFTLFAKGDYDIGCEPRQSENEQSMANHISEITIEKIIERIEAEIERGSRLSVREVALWSGYSHRHLQRLFLMYTGIPLRKIYSSQEA
ncbi:hypothetical protein ACLB1N_21120 [Escherichia coli]